MAVRQFRHQETIPADCVARSSELLGLDVLPARRRHMRSEGYPALSCEDDLACRPEATAGACGISDYGVEAMNQPFLRICRCSSLWAFFGAVRGPSSRQQYPRAQLAKHES
ncbi:hypothetical protein [Burkholderia ubonensis]|uniref:hypothetical protein n=1 Tax=Burkholderia ubonensis TaxID=101571 RepID=UPI0012F8BB00|nr:hypothetical protein [Burkholderia ubonensis]